MGFFFWTVKIKPFHRGNLKGYTIMEWLTILILFILISLLLIIYWYAGIPKNLPPGPIGLPLLGYAPFIERELHKTFNKLRKHYGNLFHLYLGSQVTIVLNDFETIKEAFVKQGDVFGGRPSVSRGIEFINDWFQGIVFTDGDYWKQHRRFIMQNLKDNGIGKFTLEPQLMNEIDYFLKEIQQHNEKPLQLLELLTMSMTNNIQLLVTGQRFQYSDPTPKYIAKIMKEFETIVRSIVYVLVFPWATWIIKIIYSKDIKKGFEINKAAVHMIKSALSDAKNKFVDGQDDNYLQSYMTEREKRLRKNNKENIFTEEGIIHNTRDLLLGGTDTSATTLVWAAIYMVFYPEVQKKVQQEIDQIIGRDREPSFNDRLNTPYTEATINEIHRFATIGPVGILHRTMKSTTLRGYYIPKNAFVFSNIHAVHHSRKLWGDPENFRPERFLNANGECVKPEYLIPFSIGKRACPGEPLARMVLYLYLVSMLQRFNFVSPNGEKPSLDSISHITVTPISDAICFVPRHE